MSWYRKALLIALTASGCSTVALKPAEESARARREVEDTRATFTRPWAHGPSTEESDRAWRTQ